MCQHIVSLFPGFHNLFVTLFLCDQTTFVVLRDQVHSILCFLDQLWLLRRHSHIGDGYGHRCPCGIFVSHRFDIIQNFRCLRSAMSIDNFLKDLFQTFFTHMEIDFQKQLIARNASIHKSQILRKNLIKEETA